MSLFCRVSLAIFAVSTIVLAGCSSADKSASGEKFVVDYYSMGGFAGGSEGLSLTSDGLVTFWRGRTPEMRSVLDSLRLDQDRLRPIAEALADDTLYSVQEGRDQNLTNVLTVHCGTRSMTTRFSPGSLPAGSSASLQRLLTELQKIHRQNH